MKAQIFLAAFMLVLPTQLTGITTTHHDKSEKALPGMPLLPGEQMEELSPASTTRINVTERQRRLIPYMTFYLTRNLNRPSNQLQELREPPQQFITQVVPQKITIQPYHGKIIVVDNNQQKYEQQNNQPILVYQPKSTYTPFMESNKLPGGFTPIRGGQVPQPIRVQVINPNVQHASAPTKEPNYSLIFDKLLQLKQMQYNKPPQYMPVQLQPPERPDHPERQKVNVAAQYFRNYATPRPPTKYVTLENYTPEGAPIKPVPTKYVTVDYQGPPEIRYKTPPPVKSPPKYITISGLPQQPPPLKSPPKYITLDNYQPEQERYKPPTPTKTYIHTYTPANIDISNENKIQNYENFESLKTYNQIPPPEKEYEPTPVIQQQIQPQVQTVETIEPIRQYTKPDNYQTPTPKPILLRPIYQTYQPVYEESTIPPPTYTPTENPHSLSVILKQLQDSNTLPQTLTPDNIDNSIKTLVHILNALKQTQKFQRPIVVAPEDTSQQENLDDYDDDDIPETVSHAYPAETPEGGTPGKPGIDYPAHSFIPQTNFNCKKQRYKGFFGDPDTNCQVWHYCDLNGGQASFLCPNGTIFSQVALTCDWWYNVKCATTTQLYVLNERLYKYILPFTPKFPEDYSGPLVDRYLALKFKEMEEKMKKQKKGKTEKPADDVQDSEVNKLQDLEDESEAAESQTQEQTTQISKEVSSSSNK